MLASGEAIRRWKASLNVQQEAQAGSNQETPQPGDAEEPQDKEGQYTFDAGGTDQGVLSIPDPPDLLL